MEINLKGLGLEMSPAYLATAAAQKAKSKAKVQAKLVKALALLEEAQGVLDTLQGGKFVKLYLGQTIGVLRKSVK